MKVEWQFAANLRACRKRAGLSQEALGFRASLHRTEIGLFGARGQGPAHRHPDQGRSGAQRPARRPAGGIGWQPGKLGEPTLGRFEVEGPLP